MDTPPLNTSRPDDFDHLPGDGVDGTGVALVWIVVVLALLWWICSALAFGLLILMIGVRALSGSPSSSRPLGQPSLL